MSETVESGNTGDTENVRPESKPFKMDSENINYEKSKSFKEKIRDARNETDNHIGFFSALLAIIIGSLMGMIALFITNAVPLAMILIGSFHLTHCTIRKGIPIMLLLNGVTVLAQSVVINVMKWFYGKNSKKEKKPPVLEWISFGLLIASLICFITLSVLVYGSDAPTFDDPNADTYCSATLFLFSFWLLNIIYIMIVFIIGLSLLISIYACLIK